MEGPGIPVRHRQVARRGPVRGSHALGPVFRRPWQGAGGSWRRLAAHAPAVAVPAPALGHASAVMATAAVVALIVVAQVLVAVARAAADQWFWWRARSQPARDLRRLLRSAESSQAAEHLAEGLAARHQAVVEAYVRAHATTDVPGSPRRTSRRPDDVPRPRRPRRPR